MLHPWVAGIRHCAPSLCQAQRLYTPELMELAMVGLGRMGGNMTDRLVRGGHRVVAYDLNAAAVDRAAAGGAIKAGSLEAVVQLLKAPRVIWIMLPAGKIVDETLNKFAALLSVNDIVVD